VTSPSRTSRANEMHRYRIEIAMEYPSGLLRKLAQGLALPRTRLLGVSPHLRKTVMLPGCGHWTQQERPAEVNAALLESPRGL
jgi:pimeloyl-ACP methyl ester carboxylesterase